MNRRARQLPLERFDLWLELCQLRLQLNSSEPDQADTAGRLRRHQTRARAAELEAQLGGVAVKPDPVALRLAAKLHHVKRESR